MNGGSNSFTLEVGYIALLAGGIGVATTLWTSVNERTKEIGTMKAIGAKPLFILSMFLSDAVLIGLIRAAMGIGTGIGLAISCVRRFRWSCFTYHPYLSSN
jgi:putative ABC transport system permease protein